MTGPPPTTGSSWHGTSSACSRCCIARDLEQVQAGRAKVFPRQVITLFQGALALRDQFLAGVIDEAALQAAHDHKVEELFDLSEQPRVNAANERLAKHLYHYGEQWLTFPGGSEHPGDEPQGRAGLEDADCQPQGLGREPHGGRGRGPVRAAIDVSHVQAARGVVLGIPG